MQLIQQRYQGVRDQERMMALVRNHPQENFHIVDLPYRFSSWAFDNADNIALWEDEQGELLAWAVLQTPFWAIDYAYHPGIVFLANRKVNDWRLKKSTLWFV
jgi:hypothetical protein